MSFGGVSDLVFDEDGFFGHTRAIERLALMLSDIGYHGGDGNQSGDVFNNYATSPGNGQGGVFHAQEAIPSGGGAVHYLGTLDLPIFGGSNTVAGNTAGTGAVDWQQVRTAATQVASGSYATIVGGYANTASGNYSLVGGFNNQVTGNNSFCFGSQMIVSGDRSFSFFGNPSTPTAATDSASFHTLFDVGGNHNYAFAGNGLQALSSHVFAWENGRLGGVSDVIRGSLTNVMMLGGNTYVNQFTAGNTGVVSNGMLFESHFTSTAATSGGLTNFLLFASVANNQGNFGLSKVYAFNSTVGHAGAVGNADSIFAVNATVAADGLSGIIALGGAPATPVSGSVYLNASAGSFPTWASSTRGVAVNGIFGSSGAFGCNNKTPQTAVALGAALGAAPGVYSGAYAQSQTDQLNLIRTALIANGICA